MGFQMVKANARTQINQCTWEDSLTERDQVVAHMHTKMDPYMRVAGTKTKGMVKVCLTDNS